MRIDKLLSNSGIGSRSEVKNIIKDKRVTINDVLVRSTSLEVNPDKDVVKLDGEVVSYKEFYYILMNKPKGYVSARVDNVYPPITDLVSEFNFVNLSPVGRLDVDTTGVILLTNDGELTHKLISPRYNVNKTYEVEVDSPLDNSLILKFKEGITLDDELLLPADLVIVDKTHAELTIHQGKFHQVKRMFKKFNFNVINLNRKKFAFLTVGDLDMGEYRELTSNEVKMLKELVNH